MTFIVFGALEIVTFMITFLFTRERVNTADDDKRLKIPVTLGFKALVKNKYWFMAALNPILIFIAQGINGSAEVYYTKIVLGNSDLVGAHVQKANSSDKSWYITPLCKACNQRTDEFDVFWDLVPVPSNL